MGRQRLAAFGAVTAIITLATIVPPASAKVCKKPDGKFIGVANQVTCPKGTQEAFKGPGRGFLGLFPGAQINYETAQAQGNQKTRDYWKEAGKSIKRSTPEELRRIERAQAQVIEKERTAFERESARREIAEKKSSLEEDIKENFALSLTGVSQKVSRVSCEPTKDPSVWMCNIKLLGSEPRLYRIEVDGSSWAGKPV